MVGYLYDETHQGLVSLTQFLGNNIEPEVYKTYKHCRMTLFRLIPRSIFFDFEPSVAWMLARPLLPPYTDNSIGALAAIEALFAEPQEVVDRRGNFVH